MSDCCGYQMEFFLFRYQIRVCCRPFFFSTLKKPSPPLQYHWEDVVNKKKNNIEFGKFRLLMLQ